MTCTFNPLTSLQASYRQFMERENDNTMLAICSMPIIGGVISILRHGYFPDPSREANWDQKRHLYQQRSACLEFALKANIIHSIANGIFLGLLVAIASRDLSLLARCKAAGTVTIVMAPFMGFILTVSSLLEISLNRQQAARDQIILLQN